MNSEYSGESRLRILHIEDSPQDAEIIREVLLDSGFFVQIDWAANEQEFSVFLQQDKYDLIIADYQLVKYDAQAALKLTQSLCPDVPFICVSGTIVEERAVELIKEGATDYIMKTNLDKLPLAIRRALAEVREHKARRQAEEELKENGRFLIEAQQIANIGSWSWIIATDEVRWSRQLYEIIGYNPQLPPPHLIEHASFFTVESWALLSQTMEKAVNEGTPFVLDLDMVRPDGQIRQLSVKGNSDKDESGRIVRLYGTKQDITERKQIEKIQLFLAEACSGTGADEPFFNMLASYLAKSLDMDFVCIDRLEGDNMTARTLAVWCDGHFEKNMTYALKDTPCGDAAGMDICCFPAEVSRLFPNDQVLQDLKAESYVGVTLWSRANRPIGLIAVIGRKPLPNRSLAETVLKLVSVRAASELERLEAEEEKVILETQLQQAQKMEAEGRLAGGVAHDFNNMLTIILGHAQLALMDMEPTQPLHEHLVSIQSAGNRSADLTRQLLAFASKQTIAPIVLDLNEAVSGMFKMMQRLIGENIRLTWRPGIDLWQVNVDPSQIDQILANLCVNARDAIADVGMITIETGNSTFDSDCRAVNAGVSSGEFVWLSVADDGCGIDVETLTHIFEPFFTTKAVGQGTGLGLATVYGIAKQNNGFIDVYSESGIGATFKIYLPRHQGKAGQPEMDVSMLPVPRGQETILLVEDELAILNMTAMILKKQGYAVVAANSPGQAIKIAGEYIGEIHLLITDVVMPEMNGRDLANKLLPLHPHMKQLFMSGYTANVIAHHGVLENGVHFIHKPFSLPGLATKVREVLDGK